MSLSSAPHEFRPDAEFPVSLVDPSPTCRTCGHAESAPLHASRALARSVEAQEAEAAYDAALVQYRRVAEISANVRAAYFMGLISDAEFLAGIAPGQVAVAALDAAEVRANAAFMAAAKSSK